MIRGTTAPGARNEAETAKWVRGMFDRIAPRYDFLNHLLSFHLDRWWRTRAVASVKPILSQPGGRILDLCCGSGDLLIALAKHSRSTVFGSDFSHQMLRAASSKTAAPLFEADALDLPLADNSIHLVTAAFGLRNFVDYRRGLAEIYRVLKPGGTVAILEFTIPPNAVFRWCYKIFSRTVLPIVGGWVSGSREAYTYLPDSVSKFPGAPELAGEIASAGFRDITYRYMTFGAVALHLAVKDSPR